MSTCVRDFIMKFTTFYISKYTVEGELILYNTFSGKLVKVKKENVPIVTNMMEKKNFPADESHIYMSLREGGFIVHDSIDEFKVADAYLEAQLNQRKTLAITIMPTEQCNFRCVYCYEDHKEGGMNEQTIENTIKYIKEKIPELKSLSIAWFGGEPLLELGTIEYISSVLIEECKKHHVLYHAFMTTNGYLLTYDTFLLLYKKCRVTSYQITIDGCQSTHDQHRFLKNGEGTFQTIWNNLTEIKKHTENRFFCIDIRTNFSKSVYDESGVSFVKLLNDAFGGDHRFSIIWRKTFGIDASDCLSHDQYSKMFDLLNNSNLNLWSEYRLSLPIFGLCAASKKGNIVIGADGTIYKCTVALNRELNKLGNINHPEKFDIKKLSFWETRRKDSETFKNECVSCNLYPLCLGCICPNNMYVGDNILCKKQNLSVLNEKLIMFSKMSSCIII